MLPRGAQSQQRVWSALVVDPCASGISPVLTDETPIMTDGQTIGRVSDPIQSKYTKVVQRAGLTSEYIYLGIGLMLAPRSPALSS